MAGTLVAVVFALTGGYSLIRVAAGFSGADRVTSLTHVAMSAAMVLTAWPRLGAVPAVVQIVVFAAAALWYVYLLAARGTAELGPLLGHHGGSRGLLAYHAFMMASMIWMALAMSPFVTAAAPRAMAGMPGMATGEAGGALAVSARQAAAVSTGLGVLYALAAIGLLGLFVARAARGLPRGRLGATARLDAAGSVAMAAGMAVAFLTLMG